VARYDWDYFRHKYVTGDDAVTLEHLSKQPNAPSLHRLKIKSSEQSWAEQRKTFRNQAATIATAGATGQEAIRQTQQLVDAAEMIARHVKLARALQSIATEALQKKMITAAELTARDVLAWLNQGVQMERLALDLATSRVEVEAKIDFSKLTDEQLERIAAGEDISKVVAA
jgi:hypothetical protein